LKTGVYILHDGHPTKVALRLLVSRSADQTALDEGLEAALIARDTEAIEELLVRGANVNRHFNLFNTAISNGDEVIARLSTSVPETLRTPKPLCNITTRNTSKIIANT
jgi:molybdopterin converting factor small subunit